MEVIAIGEDALKMFRDRYPHKDIPQPKYSVGMDIKFSIDVVDPMDLDYNPENGPSVIETICDGRISGYNIALITTRSTYWLEYVYDIINPSMRFSRLFRMRESDIGIEEDY